MPPPSRRCDARWSAGRQRRSRRRAGPREVPAHCTRQHNCFPMPPPTRRCDARASGRAHPTRPQRSRHRRDLREVRARCTGPRCSIPTPRSFHPRDARGCDRRPPRSRRTVPRSNGCRRPVRPNRRRSTARGHPQTNSQQQRRPRAGTRTDSGCNGSWKRSPFPPDAAPGEATSPCARSVRGFYIQGR